MEKLSAATQNLKPERRHLTADLIAGLTFAVVNVPQAMAHALLATVNPVLGIYTLMVAAPLGAIFTSSVFMNVSTTGALAVAAAAALEVVGAGQPAQALVALVMLVGVIQLLAGLFRLGFLIRFVSNSVMTGFLNGVAVLIILGQLGDLTGFSSSFSNRVLQTLELMLRPTPHQPADDDHRAADPGVDRAAAGYAAAQVRLPYRHCCVHPAAGRVVSSSAGDRVILWRCADGGRHLCDSPHAALVDAS